MTEQRAAFEAWDELQFKLPAGYYSTFNGEYYDAAVLGRWQAWQAALSALPAGGWKLVPIEPTQEMTRAAYMSEQPQQEKRDA